MYWANLPTAWLWKPLHTKNIAFAKYGGQYARMGVFFSDPAFSVEINEV